MSMAGALAARAQAPAEGTSDPGALRARRALAMENLLADIRASGPERHEALVQAWLASGPEAPAALPDGTTVFVRYAPEARSVSVVGDMTQWEGELPLSRLGASGLWHREARFEPRARLDYLLVEDGRRLLDPLCPKASPGRGGEERNVWTGPLCRPSELEGAPGPSRRGQERAFEVGGRRVFVRTPAAYRGDPARRFGTAYFLDGELYREAIRAGDVADLLAERGDIEPLVLAFAPSAPLDGPPSEHVAWLADQLVPSLEKGFRVRAEPGSRLLVASGADGLGKVALQSPLADRDGGEAIRRISRAFPRSKAAFHVEAGTYDSSRAQGGLGAIEATRRLRTALASRDHKLTYSEFPAGRSPGFWRERLPFVLRSAFPAPKRPEVEIVPNPRKPR
jgi:enterochelin esterase-like enzyme